MQSFSLIHGPLKNISYNLKIIFNGEEYFVISSIAMDNSLVIRKKLLKHPNLTEIKINFDDPYDDFKQIAKLFRGKAIQFNREIIDFLIKASYELKMESLYLESQKFFNYLNEMKVQLDKSAELYELTELQSLLESLTSENFAETTKEIEKLHFFDTESNCKTFGRLVLSACRCKYNNTNTYIDLIEYFSKKVNNLVTLISGYYLSESGNESKFLVESFINRGLLDENLFRTVSYRSIYFIHRFFKIDPIYYFTILQSLPTNIEELSKNDWALHRKYALNGFNHSVFAGIIRNDDCDKLQKYFAENGLPINTRISQSIYERCTLLNNSPSSIQYAAYFGALKCFKYLLLSNALENETTDDLSKYAVAGGNLEIIRLCDEYKISFNGTIEIAIEYNQFAVFEWIMRVKPKVCKDIHQMLIKCIQKSNMKIFRYLLEIGVGIYKKNNIAELVIYAAAEDNFKLIKFLLDSKQIHLRQRPNELTPLHIACQMGYYDVVEYLLSFPETNINATIVFS